MIKYILPLLCIFFLDMNLSFAHQYIEITAPIFPNVMILYEHETCYPYANCDEELWQDYDVETNSLVDSAALKTEDLIEQCIQFEYDILPNSNENPLTTEEIASNYQQIALCAYEVFTSKPYWIPKLIDDVDICAYKYGSDYRLITEEDVLNLSDDELEQFGLILSSSAGNLEMGGFYFSSQVYVRGLNGDLLWADLNYLAEQPEDAVDNSWRIEALNVEKNDENYKHHYESSIGLRCIKTESVSQ